MLATPRCRPGRLGSGVVNSTCGGCCGNRLGLSRYRPPEDPQIAPGTNQVWGAEPARGGLFPGAICGFAIQRSSEMRHARLRQLVLLAGGVFMFQMGGCAITDAIGNLVGSLLPGA